MLSKDQLSVEALSHEVECLKREIEKKNDALYSFSQFFLNELDWEQRHFERTKDEFYRGGVAAMKNIEKHYEFVFMKRLDGEKV
ncbi:hypothetical protein [Bacillus pumilus]|uniref:hypothetical protein n=1 Tax=Bacillus pumilus TaxID=1408 RepID=UPI002282E03C|nr:hypothetical protein [Bacillus pumilus]MCY7572333.1 hypothetical protein [Bacillus pumilus]MEC3762008.1 hypothetical protein [Bacillus pumilus]